MLLHSLEALCTWMGTTALSQAIQTIDWIVPAAQTVHILALAAVVTSALLINLRLLGVRAADQPLAGLARRFLPFVWWPLPILVVSGAILVMAEPMRRFENPVSVLKMGLLLIAAVVTVACQLPLQRDPKFWEISVWRKRVGQLIAATSMPVWIAIVCTGRWIAYV